MIFEQLLEVVAALFFAFLLSALKGGLYAGSMAGKYRALSVNSARSNQPTIRRSRRIKCILIK